MPPTAIAPGTTYRADVRTFHVSALTPLNAWGEMRERGKVFWRSVPQAELRDKWERVDALPPAAPRLRRARVEG